jgi:hypothetical protein
MLGGLVTTLLHGLVGVPGLYLLFGSAREPELDLAELPADVATDYARPA